MKRAAVLAALLLLSSCKILNEANEFKGRGRIDLLFPLDLIPGLSSVLPHIVLDVSGGFEWSNAEDEHRRQIELIRLQAEVAEILRQKEQDDLEEAILHSLRTGDPIDAQLRTNDG